MSCTLAGLFSPDFAVKLRTSELLLLEVKGSICWNPPESEPRIKARSARGWAQAQSAEADRRVAFGVALDSDVVSVGTFSGLRERLLDGG